MRKTHVVLHHSATKDTGTLSWPAIRFFHVGVKGWLDIGYHIGIEWHGDKDDGHYEVMLGRPLDADGAHCPQGDMNRHAIGVCFVGDYDLYAPPVEMLQCAAKHLRPIMDALGIPADMDHVHAHRHFNPDKTCPGAQFSTRQLLDLLR